MTSAAERYDRTTVRWGRGAEMTAVDAATWHWSDRGRLRAVSMIVELLDETPDWERLVNGHRWALGRVPRLRQRVVADPVRIGPPAWADTQVDLDHHLRRVPLGEDGSFADVLNVAGAMHDEWFDRDRPLWMAALVEGLPEGRAAYVLKLHHAMADDQAVVALFDLLHSDRRTPTTGPAQLPDGVHEPVTPLQLSARHAVRALQHAPLTAGRALVAGVRRPTRTVRTSAELARAVVGTFAGRSSGSPLLDHRGGIRAFGSLEAPTERLRAVGAAAGARSGDVLLAAIADGLGRYHAALGSPVDELPIALPLNLRLDVLGDHFARARIVAPTAPMSPATRIAVLRERIAAAERRRPVDVLATAAPLLSRAPTAVAGAIIERAARPLALRLVVVRGLDRDAYLAGARVERLFSFGPTAGCALSATVVTHRATSCVGFSYDVAAVRDPVAMDACVRAALADLLRAPAPRRRARRAA